MRLKTLGSLFLSGLILLSSTTALAQRPGPPPRSAWTDQVRISGDLRLRHGSVYQEQQVDRHRQRFRLRINGTFAKKDFMVGVRLASGEGGHNSNNQSFDDFFRLKEVYIDRAYLAWKSPGIHGLEIRGGKMPNPFYKTPASDVMWDTDINPEGLVERFQFRKGKNLKLALAAGQFILDEDKTDNNDQWLFGQQFVAAFQPWPDTRARVALAYYDFVNLEESSLGGTSLTGNTVVSVNSEDVLINDYNVLHLTAQLNIRQGSIPVVLLGDYLRNLADPRTEAGEASGDTGYQIGLIFGRAKSPGSWEAAYFYKVLEADATVAALPDSDFGAGGTDRRGQIVWAAYQMTKGLKFKVRYVNTESESQPGTDAINRLQADLSVKF